MPDCCTSQQKKKNNVTHNLIQFISKYARIISMHVFSPENTDNVQELFIVQNPQNVSQVFTKGVGFTVRFFLHTKPSEKIYSANR